MTKDNSQTRECLLALDQERRKISRRRPQPGRGVLAVDMPRVAHPCGHAIVRSRGYLAYDAHAADLLFQVVSRRYDKKSIVITTTYPSHTGTPCVPTRRAPSR